MSEPEPASGWSRQVAVISDALIVPPDRNAMVQRVGVLTPEGNAVSSAALWRHGQLITLPPDPVPEPVPRLRGRYLWGGLLFGHFGHFLTESTTRLWALDAIDPPPDGVIFVLKRPNEVPELRAFQKAVFGLFGVTVPVHVVKAPVRVDALIVAGQGFGLGRISQGTPEMQSFVRRRFAATVAADGPEKLYVSRSGLGERASMILCETLLEDCLRAEGYHIFHPEAHGLAVQIARFRAARQIIIADGSAAHLLGLVARPDQQVAYLLRRNWFADAPIQQISGFSGRPPEVINALRHQWVPHNLPGVRDLSFAELDFARLQTALHQAGFVSRPEPWRRLKSRDLRAAFERMGLWGKLVRSDQTKEPRTA